MNGSAKLRDRVVHRRIAALAMAGVVFALAACEQREEAAPEPVRPVRVVTAEPQQGGQTVTLTGTIRAEEEVNLAFRVGGRMIERLVNVGDPVEGGQRVARLQSETQRNAVQAARAELAAAMGQVTTTRTDYERQENLLEQGFTTRVRYDQALQAWEEARARLDAAEARLAIAEEELAYTELYADAPGVVTARGAEPGEVVAAGQMVVQLARKGGRDAVFDVPERIIQQAPPDPEIVITLSTDPTVEAGGHVREVAPQADPVTRTFEVKVGLIDPPPAMRLGSTVAGRMQVGKQAGMELPSSALSAMDGEPAVFVVDPASGLVALRPVNIARYDLASVVVADGLASGDLVVTAGVQALRPGQQVRLLGETP
jgi:RND family efflux transporter MFP subunit